MTDDGSAARCVFCQRPLSVTDNLDNGLVTVNVNGHAKPAHRACADDAYESGAFL